MGLYIVIVALVLSWAGPLYAAPTLPQAQVDVTMPTVNGSTFTVNAGGNIQTAINSAAAANPALTHEVVIQAGASFQGQFILPARASGTGWVIVRSSASASLPVGIRVTPAAAGFMPKITGPTNGERIFTAAANAHHYRLIGLELLPPGGTITSRGFIATADFGPVHHVIVDRVYCHGTATAKTTGCVYMNGDGNFAMIESYAQDIHRLDADTQGFLSTQTLGPVLVRNNYLEAAGENMMLGGSDPASAALIPQDVTIIRNTIAKNPAWHANPTQWLLKTCVEFKLGIRVLFEGNIVENCFGEGGWTFRLTVRNQNGTAPWAEASDITIRYNTIRNVAAGMQFFGSDDAAVSQPSKRYWVHDNVWYNLATFCIAGDQCGRFFQWQGGGAAKGEDFAITHNTIIGNGNSLNVFTSGSAGSKGYLFRDNIGQFGTYGVTCFSSTGTTCLDTIFSTAAYPVGYTWTNNVVVGGSPSGYPSGNFWPNMFNDVGFVDMASGNYRLSSSSPYKTKASDGKDIGVDIDALTAAQQGTLQTTQQGGGDSTSPVQPTNLRIF